MRTPTKTMKVIGLLATAGTLALAGCGGGSTAAAPSAAVPSTAASTAPNAEASGDTASGEAASGAFPPVADGDVSYQAWNDSFGKGEINLFITNTGAAPVSCDRFSLLQSQGIAASGSTIDVGASSGCFSGDEIPVGSYVTVFLSGFASNNIYSKVTLVSASGDGSTITVPVNAGEIESPSWN